MAQKKNYRNYSEILGNVANVYQTPESNKAGVLRFSIATTHTFTKKDGTKGEKTNFIPVLVRPNRKWANQENVKKGSFLRVIGHLEDNSFVDENGARKGGLEVNADKIVVLREKKDGTVENTETGENEVVYDANFED